MIDNWKVLRLGVVVQDMDKAVKYFQAIGADVSRPAHEHTGKSFPDEKIFGKPIDPEAKLSLKMIQLGPLQIELMQPIAGKTPHADFLKKRGPGIILVAIGVDDIKSETANLQSKGANVTLSAKLPGGRRVGLP